MIHNSFRNSRANSRRNSDDSVHSLRIGRNSVTSPTISSHKLIRQLTSKTAKGSSLIRREGSIIMIKNGKIISMRRDPSSTKLTDDVFLPSPSDSNTQAMEVSLSNHSALNKVKEESFETEPLLKEDNSCQPLTTGKVNGHINHVDRSPHENHYLASHSYINKGDKSPDGNHNLTSHSNTNENKTVNYPRNKLTRMARTRSNSDDNIVVNDMSSEIHISICDHDSGAAVGINGFKFPSSHQEYINALHHNESNNILNDMKRTSSDSNIKTHGLTTGKKSSISKSVNIVYHVPLLDSSNRQSDNLITQSSISESNMSKQCMPQYRQRWTLSKENLKK